MRDTFPWRRDRLDHHKLLRCKTRQLEVHRLISHDLMQMSIRYLNNEIDSLNCCWKQNTSLLWITWHLQLKAGPDAALDEGVREQGCRAMNRPEASAVGWDNDRRGKHRTKLG
jgi:hypothetical protein